MFVCCLYVFLAFDALVALYVKDSFDNLQTFIFEELGWT